MNDETVESRLSAMLHGLKPKAKPPIKAAVLDTWIAQAEAKLGDDAKGGRLGWLVATSVAVAAIQRAIDQDGRQLFLLKGGTLLQHRLNVTARATKDVDGLIRGDMDAFFAALDDVLAEPWGPLTLRRGEVEIINVPTKIIKPRRFDVFLELRGTVWRRVRFEVSPDEVGSPSLTTCEALPRPCSKRGRQKLSVQVSPCGRGLPSSRLTRIGSAAMRRPRFQHSSTSVWATPSMS